MLAVVTARDGQQRDQKGEPTEIGEQGGCGHPAVRRWLGSARASAQVRDGVGQRAVGADLRGRQMERVRQSIACSPPQEMKGVGVLQRATAGGELSCARLLPRPCVLGPGLLRASVPPRSRSAELIRTRRPGGPLPSPRLRPTCSDEDGFVSLRPFSGGLLAFMSRQLELEFDTLSELFRVAARTKCLIDAGESS